MLCQLNRSLFNSSKHLSNNNGSSIMQLFDCLKHKYGGKCVYSRFIIEYGVIVSQYHVDDLLLFGTNMKGIKETKKSLTSNF